MDGAGTRCWVCRRLSLSQTLGSGSHPECAENGGVPAAIDGSCSVAAQQLQHLLSPGAVWFISPGTCPSPQRRFPSSPGSRAHASIAAGPAAAAGRAGRGDDVQGCGRTGRPSVQDAQSCGCPRAEGQERSTTGLVSFNNHQRCPVCSQRVLVSSRSWNEVSVPGWMSQGAAGAAWGCVVPGRPAPRVLGTL